MSNSPYCIFLDDGGVMNDNRLRGPKWQKLVGDFFIPRYGGTPEIWNEANIKALTYEIEKMNQIIAEQPFYSYNKFSQEIRPTKIEIMFSHLGLEIPSKNECNRLIDEAWEWIMPRAHAPFPDVIDSIKKLSKKYNLYTASNEDSESLKKYLSGMGVLDCFASPEHIFGPDLIDQFKSHESYYEKIFEYVDIIPEQTIVVEDNPLFIKFAEKSGARVIQSRLDPVHSQVTKYSITNMTDLPLIVKSLIS